MPIRFFILWCLARGSRRGRLIAQAGIAAIDAHLHWLAHLEPAVARTV